MMACKVDENDEEMNQGDEDSVRTASTTVASLWTSHQNQRRLLQKYLRDDLGNSENGDEKDNSTPQPPSTSFCRLNVETNLNPPPSNWLMSGAQGHVPPGVDQLSGFDPSTHSTGFSSFRMASHFLECLGLGRFGVDVVSDAENIKKLLRMPYSNNAVSMVVHRIGETLLIDELDLHRILLTSFDEEWHWLRKFFVETILDIVENPEQALVRRNKSRDAIIERNLISKFLYRSLNPPSEFFGDVSSRGQTETETPDSTKCDTELPENYLSLPPLPEPSPEDYEPKFVSSNHEFARTLLWNFEDIRMLIGSDMPIFGDSEHPSVSLRLHNMQRPINILTGLDYWLDNLMCQVPEVLMCYHLDGIVQKYELIKTEELPKLSDNCKFSPGIIRDVAKNILAFLKSNAAKEGHTYWLFKAKDDEVVKLYDLTSLCEEVDSQKKSPSKPKPSPSEKSSESMHNPFRTAVSMLLYKVARNILNGNARKEDENSARQLLIKCLELLDKDKFPYIATSAHYMLSDIFIPNDIDPSSVNLEDLQKEDVLPPTDTKNKRHEKRKRSCTPTSTAMVGIQTLCRPSKTSTPVCASIQDDGAEDESMDDLFSQNPPPPMTESLQERCSAALEHIVSGLSFLEVLAARRDEEEISDKKSREQQERDNPKMAKPHVPIPMPFSTPQDSDRRLVVQDKSRGNGSIVIPTAPPQSWYDHLKTVLLRKAFLVYVTLAETHFLKKSFGKVLRCIKRAINCRNMVRRVEGNLESLDQNSTLSFAYGIAGDTYMAMVQTWATEIVRYIDQYNATESQAESDIVDRIEHHVEVERRDWLIKLPRDIEESLSLSAQCLKKSLECLPTSSVSDLDHQNLLKRLANVNNELGVFYMNQASNLARQLKSERWDVVSDVLRKSDDHLQEGVSHFKTLGDSVNQALVLSNLGRFKRVQAYCLSFHNADDKEDKGVGGEFSEEEFNLYLESISSYQKALSVLGQKRGKNVAIYDTLTWELSTTHFTLGCQLQDYAPLSRSSRPELVRQIADHYSKSLKYCELEKPEDDSKLPIYQYRSATVHKRLATLYHFCHRDDAVDSTHRSQHYRQLAETHYDKAIALFTAVEDHDKALKCLLKLISLLEFQAEESHQTKKALQQILSRFVQALPILNAMRSEPNESKESSTSSDSEDCSERERDSLLQLLVQRCQQNLLGLNKFLIAQASSKKANKHSDKSDLAKKLYTRSLKLPQIDDPMFLSDLCTLIEDLANDLQKLK